ncbi:hypothetical protein RDI58_000671 [Solanum bulbocastanum]|uniref:Uncharacterized protein n=1 Tax=Solanum bulbocastanum TaxID=147425 RepID=A0AAN8UCK9_SOLBU
MIKTIGPDHSCGKDNNTIRFVFLAKNYVEEFRINPNWGMKEFHVMRSHNCTISLNQAYKAKRKALDLITGTKEEQFEMLWDYCAELRKSNPGTTSCKQGFLARCRPIIGIDGCHLKGNQQRGQLLTAVGNDGNINMYPIAFAIVEGIPCNNAIVAIWVKKGEPEMYVHECYTVEQYMKSYNPSILPIVSFDQWPKIGIEPLLPSIYKAQPGRPKKL